MTDFHSNLLEIDFFKRVEFSNLAPIQQQVIEDKKVYDIIAANAPAQLPYFAVTFTRPDFDSHALLRAAVSQIMPWTNVSYFILLFFRPESRFSGIHIDNTHDLPNHSKFGLNIPIMNCVVGETYTHWYEPKPDEKPWRIASSEPNGIDFNGAEEHRIFEPNEHMPAEYEARQLRIWQPEQVVRVASVSYATPHLVNTAVPHCVENNCGKVRVVLSARFTKFNWEK